MNPLHRPGGRDPAARAASGDGPSSDPAPHGNAAGEEPAPRTPSGNPPAPDSAAHAPSGNPPAPVPYLPPATAPDPHGTPAPGAHRAPGPREPRPVRLLRAVTPAYGAEVMATGVLASGLETVGVRWAAEVMLALAALSWLLLAALFAVRLGARAARRSRRWAEEADTPASLTGVAATSVLGTGFALLGAHGLATALLALAALLWPRLLPDVLWHERHRGLPGAAYLVCVATQSLVVLGCTLAAALGWGWVLWPAAALLLLGLLLYALVLARFDFRQLRIGPGDHWVACGAVSISALAAAKLTNATALLLGAGWRHTAVDVLQVVTGVLIGVALAWYAVLVCCEVRWPRPRYEVRRWSTVFPLGMTALAAMVAGTVLDSPALRGIGRALLGPALVVWAAVAVGLVRAVAAGRASR